MPEHTAHIVPSYDFSEALALPVQERFARSLESAKAMLAENGYQEISDFPCVPGVGATEAELKQLESDLGVALPSEYRQFLAICRYLKIDDGREVGGLDHEGVHVTESPWVSVQHRSGVPYLVFANYWQFADGDQLMFDLSDDGHSVIAYLHEHGPLFELYAPTFSLALWRLTHEAEVEA
jgi:hypothetical protein